LFWKKKSDDIIAEFDQIENREVVRVKPRQQFYIHYNEQKTALNDICINGPSFEAEELSPGDIIDISFHKDSGESTREDGEVRLHKTD